MEENAKSVLQNYSSDISEKNLKLFEKQIEWAHQIEERSYVFSQFLFSVGVAFLAIFLSINDLVINKTIFNFAIAVSLFSFIVFVFSFKEKLDHDSEVLIKSYKKSESDFKEARGVLDRQIENGINLNTFYEDITDLSDKTKKDISDIDDINNQEIANYSLEFYLFCSLSSFWLFFFSTKTWCTLYLFIGLIVIFYISNNQNKYFYKLTKQYSKLMSKIFPINNK